MCQKDAPHAKLILCTPPHATSTPDYSNCGHADQVEKATLFVRKLAKENNIPIFVLGNGTNLLVRDEGFRGIVLQVKLEHIEIKE